MRNYTYDIAHTVRPHEYITINKYYNVVIVQFRFKCVLRTHAECQNWRRFVFACVTINKRPTLSLTSG